MVIKEPIVSLRTAPIAYEPLQEPDVAQSRKMFGRYYERAIQLLAPAMRDPLQDTQLLYNEPVQCVEELTDGWIKVNAIEQLTFDRKTKQWKPMQGYIQRDQAMPVHSFVSPNIVVKKPWSTVLCDDGSTYDLPMGTKLRSIRSLIIAFVVSLLNGKRGTIPAKDVFVIQDTPEETDTLRSMIVGYAQQLIGEPYCWGGRSPLNRQNKKFSSSNDCSGFINLAVRCAGLEIARDATPLSIMSNTVTHGRDLLPSDCIFFSHPENLDYKFHILMYLGNDQVIESGFNGIKVTNAKERFGQSLKELSSGDLIQLEDGSQHVIYFGSYLNDISFVQKLRAYAKGHYTVLIS